MLDDLLDASQDRSGQGVDSAGARQPSGAARRDRRGTTALHPAGRPPSSHASSRVAPSSCRPTGYDSARSSTTSCPMPSSSRRRAATSSCHSPKQKAHAVVTVRDSGSGFDEQFASKLFEPFAQTEQGRDRAAGGLGLGLAIAQPFGHASRRISFRGQRGAQQRRSLYAQIPLAVGTGDARRTDPPATAGGRKTVLVVEDNQDAEPTASSTCSN